MPDLDALPEVPHRVVHRTARDTWVGACPGGWFVVDPSDGSVEVRDPHGGLLDEWRVPTEALAPPNRSRITVDARRRTVVVSQAAQTVVVDRGGRSTIVPHARWERNAGGAVGDPVVTDRSRLWVVAADEPTGILPPQPRTGVVTLVDGERGEVLDALVLDDGHPEGYTVLAVDGHGVVVNGAYGQDGSQTWFLRIGDDDRIEHRALGWTGIATAVDPARGEILFMPHDDTVVEVRRWWDGEVVLAVDGTDLFGDPADAEEEPDGFGYEGTFVDAGRIVVATWLDRLLVLDRATGAPLGWFDVDGDLGATDLEHVGGSHVLVRGAGGAALVTLVDDERRPAHS